MAYHSSSWRLQSGESAIWERPLGLTELSFHWDAVFNRTADTLQHAEVQIDPTRLQQAFDPSNVARTWINLKNRYPLLGAQLDERDDNNVFFIVSKEILNTIRPGEILMQKISSANEAADFADRMVVGESRLSDKLLACIVIFERTDIPNYFHLLIQVTHSITDGMSNITILKTFLDELCRNSPLEFSLEDRLSLAIASEDLRPQRKYSIARRRWRKAIASVISQKRTSRMMKGGHTLPRKVSQTTPHTPAHSKSISISFPPEKSTIIINHCRQKKMTFGNVYPVLGQIALTRVLIRKYLRGDINEEEWQFRIREPMVSAGPLNLRPFLDKEWLNAGGRTNVCLSIGFFAYRLPSMPLGGRQLRPGMSMPAFESLLSKERFWRRSLLVKNQALNYIKHPLLLEFLELTAPFRVQRAITAGRQWRLESGPPKHLSDRSLTPMEQASNGLVFGNGGSSLGNIDLLQPRKYPLINGKEPSDPLLELKRSTTKLRCRPTELYLGAATSNGQLHLSVLWDGNVYENDLVEEWLQEVRNATDFYLGSKEHIQAKL